MIHEPGAIPDLCHICGNPTSAKALSAACASQHHAAPSPAKPAVRSVKCDLCSTQVTTSYVDGATQYGPWANMCLRCHRIHGNGLGLGRGQKFDVATGKKLEG